MRAKCSQCSAINESSLPILLVVCSCGNMLRFRPTPSDMVSKPPDAVDVDHYRTLGLVRPVTDDEVRSAYRERVKQCHPDRGGDAAEFDAVTIAYKSIRDPESRRRYDASLHEAARSARTSVKVPDLVSKRAADASALLEGVPVAPHVMIVPVEARDRRARRIIGQLPVPGSQVDAGSGICLVLAVPRSSTLWFQVKAYAGEVAESFLDGFLRGGGVASAQRALPAANQSVGVQVAGAVGEIAGATARASVGVASCLFRLWAISFGVVVVGILLWAAPPIGIIAFIGLVWLTVRSSTARSKRKRDGLWY